MQKVYRREYSQAHSLDLKKKKPAFKKTIFLCHH